MHNIQNKNKKQNKLNFIINNNLILNNNTNKLLRITYDYKSTFITNIKKLKKACTSRINIIKKFKLTPVWKHCFPLYLQ